MPGTHKGCPYLRSDPRHPVPGTHKGCPYLRSDPRHPVPGTHKGCPYNDHHAFVTVRFNSSSDSASNRLWSSAVMLRRTAFVLISDAN